MLWPQANVKALTHLSAVAREFPPQQVPKGGVQLTLGAQIDREGAWPQGISQQTLAAYQELGAHNLQGRN